MNRAFRRVFVAESRIAMASAATGTGRRVSMSRRLGKSSAGYVRVVRAPGEGRDARSSSRMSRIVGPCYTTESIAKTLHLTTDDIQRMAGAGYLLALTTTDGHPSTRRSNSTTASSSTSAMFFASFATASTTPGPGQSGSRDAPPPPRQGSLLHLESSNYAPARHSPSSSPPNTPPLRGDRDSRVSRLQPFFEDAA